MATQYHILERVGTTGGSHLHRGRRVADGAPVLLKLLAPEDVLAEGERFRREYAILRDLAVPGVAKPVELVDEPGKLMMVLDTVEGDLFDSVLERKKYDVLGCLRLAAQLGRTLGALHAAHVVHHDFRPANLMLLSDGSMLVLDLSLATTESIPSGAPYYRMVGDWAYISPEQTGRINRVIDYRTDYYSLGVMLFRMLTGRLPCQGADPLEWTHCHLASVPDAPSEIDPAIPVVLSAIVLKLLQKMPEDRYQSMHGLLYDLTLCRRQVEGELAPAPFPLGVHDTNGRLQLPRKLIDREQEQAALLASHEAMLASGRPALVMVAGGAGVGKTALIESLRKPALEKHGFFIAGTFDQYQRDIPYGTITQAFRSLVEHILAESEEDLERWRRQILAALGANGQLIVDVLPQLELVIGPQQPPVPVPPAEAQNRFRLVFLRFIGVFAQQAHPLTIFLDNLHWADDASLRLLKEMASASRTSWLMVIGSYRDDEVGADHPLAKALDELRKDDIALAEIALGPLSREALGELVEDMLHCERGAAAPLVELIYAKTGGNPFFAGQFVSTLAEEGLLVYDVDARAWRWDLERISGKDYTDNVAELVIVKLARLPAAARSLLQVLACLGVEVQESVLLRLYAQPDVDAETALSVATRAGMVYRAGGKVRFLHDRVQEAAYLSLPAAARAALHARLGRLLLAGKSDEEVEDEIFAIADQYNRGAAALSSADDLDTLQRLNFMAGMRAKAAVAMESARRFLCRAMALLPADAWERRYPDTLELFLALAECESLAGNFDRADKLADEVLAHSASRGDSARLYLLRVALYQIAGRLDDAVASVLTGLRMFGEEMPPDEAGIEQAVEAEMQAIEDCLRGRRIADIAADPPLADQDRAAVIELLTEGLPPSYMVKPSYHSLFSARAVRLSLQHGHTESSCYTYSAYGMLLTKRNKIRPALEFSNMAMDLYERLGGRRRKGHLIATHALAFGLLSHPIVDLRPLLERSFALTLEVGDVVFASYVTMTYFWAMLQEGGPLDEALTRANEESAFSRENHHETVYQTIRFQEQLVASLKGRTRNRACMDDGQFDEAASLAALEKASFGVGLETAHTFKLVSAYIYGDHTKALEAARETARHLHPTDCLILFEAVFHFFRGLTLAALFPQAGLEQQREFAQQLAEDRERHRLWAEACPRNFANRLALLDAEIARIEGRHDDAARLYETAIRSASENGFVQQVALAFELASCFYRDRGFDLIADTYLREARAAWGRWGADGKVAQLDSAHPELMSRGLAPSFGAGQLAHRLDLLSIAKTAQAISGQIVLPELVDTLMHIVLENAGAQTGYLVLVRGEALMLAADARIDKGQTQVNVHVDRALPPGLLPTSVVNYVRRRRSQVMVADVSQPSAFSRDPYFAGGRARSVLCLPVMHQDALIGMLYLESNLVTHAFAPDRVAVLQVLASQAAISLDNARLYADLQEREARIRRLFESNIVSIMFFDLDGRVTDANDAALSMLGYTREELRAGAIRWREITPQEWHFADERAVAELQRTGVCRPYEKEFLRKDGSRVPVMAAGAQFEGDDRQGIGFALDLSERKRTEAQMHHMASHDTLTGLPNRSLLLDRLEQATSYAHRNGSRVAVLLLDLDYFKYINDSLGHQFGDAVLKMTANRLQKCVREGDSVARLGGDEFVVCLPALEDSHHVAHVARKILDALSQSFVIEGHELHTSGSIGISIYPDDADDVDTLMRSADTAMYHAKEQGRGNFQFFTEALNRAAQARLEVSKRLRRALFHDEFTLYYQPQVNMERGTIFAAEALLRWRRPGDQPISCGAFIASAEESGLIVPIGEWALREACRQLQSWREAGYTDLKIAVNMSPRQLEPPSFCTLVREILEETRLPADALELEITEGIFIQHSDNTLATLNGLREMGVKLSVDDFGTGYSSLSYLQRFPVHALKIDQSFVRQIGTDRNHRALITAIIAMAESLELDVMAEGVETSEQVSFLLAHGCHCAQGFYYSEAVPAQRFSSMLDSSFAAR